MSRRSESHLGGSVEIWHEKISTRLNSRAPPDSFHIEFRESAHGPVNGDLCDQIQGSTAATVQKLLTSEVAIWFTRITLKKGAPFQSERRLDSSPDLLHRHPEDKPRDDGVCDSAHQKTEVDDGLIVSYPANPVHVSSSIQRLRLGVGWKGLELWHLVL